MVCFRCGGAAKAPCSDCLIKGKPSGLHRCGACEGTGLGACSKCDGNWGSKCSRCEGTGKRTDIPEHLRGRLKGRGGIFKRISECRSCRGTGVTHGRGEDARSGVCPTCGKRRVTSERGKELCRRCKGKGGTGKCRSCQGTKTVDCTHCHPAESIAAKETEGR
jgi:hypothetical protein